MKHTLVSWSTEKNWHRTKITHAEEVLYNCLCKITVLIVLDLTTCVDHEHITYSLMSLRFFHVHQRRNRQRLCRCYSVVEECSYEWELCMLSTFALNCRFVLSSVC
jgi:hypothetical protein